MDIIDILMSRKAALQEMEARGVTIEQISTMLYQIIESGVISDVTVGSITTLNEINHGVGFRIWLGTTEEYNNILEPLPNVLYIKTDDTSAEDVLAAIAALQQAAAEMDGRIKDLGTLDSTIPLQEIFSTYGGSGIKVYRIESTSNTDIYPAVVVNDPRSSQAAVVTLTVTDDKTGVFEFVYGYKRYYCTAFYSPDGISLSGWVCLSNEAGWFDLEISGAGFSAGSPVPKYRRIGTKVYVRGQIIVDMDAVTEITTVFANLPTGFRPAKSTYRLVPGEGDRQARLYVTAAGTININYFKTYSGDTVTGSHWVQLDCEFLID